MNLSSVEDLTPDDVASPGDIQTLMSCWGQHIVDNPPTHMNNSNKLLDADSVGNAFGLIKEYLKDRFPSHPDFTDEYWFTLAKGQIVSRLSSANIRGTSGTSEEPGKVGIVRLNPDINLGQHEEGVGTTPYLDEAPDLVSIVRDVLISDLSDIHQRRLALNTTYSADGRGGEVKYLNYQSFVYDPVGRCIAADWKDIKNAKTRPITFCTDFNHWETCVYDAFGDHWNADHGLIRQRNSSGLFGLLQYFVVPMCQKRNDAWTSKIITDTLRNDAPATLKDTVTAQSLRYGATTFLYEHYQVLDPETTARSGHAPSDSSKHYFLSRRAMQYVPMRALAGYPHPRRPHISPRLRAVSSDIEHLELMEKLADKLYPTNLEEFQRGGKLRKFVRDVLATNMMNFTEKLEHLGTGAPVIVNTISAARDVGIDLARLKEMSRIIKDDFIAQNMPYSSQEEELAVAVSDSNRLVNQMMKEIADLRAIIRTQNNTIGRLETELQQRDAAAVSSPASSVRSPCRREATSPPSSQPPASRPRIEPASRPRIVPASSSSPVREAAASFMGNIPGIGPIAARAIRPAAAHPAPAAAPNVKPVSIANNIVQLRPPPIRRKKSTTGSKKNADAPEVGKIVVELARAGLLKSGTPYERTQPPPVLFPDILAPSERNKYVNAMRVVGVVVTDEQDRLFRADDPDIAKISAESNKINSAVLEWICRAESTPEKKVVVSKKMSSRVFGVGARAAALPDNSWPISRGGLWSTTYFRK